MTDDFVLREKPELKIKLNELGLVIIDASQPKKCGTFSYRNIKSVELNLKRTDWFITILSWIVGLFIFGGFDNYKNSANLKLEIENQTLKIWLNNADFNQAQRITELINDKKTPRYR